MQSPYGAFLFATLRILNLKHRPIPLELQSPYGAFLFATHRLGSSGGGRVGVAIPLRGFSFCDLGVRKEILEYRGAWLQSPYGAFLFATSGPRGSCKSEAWSLQSPYGAFLFATPGARVPPPCSHRRGCNPLTGLFFLRRVTNGFAEARRLLELQSPYGAFLFATPSGRAKFSPVKRKLQSPYGAFLFAT